LRFLFGACPRQSEALPDHVPAHWCVHSDIPSPPRKNCRTVVARRPHHCPLVSPILWQVHSPIDSRAAVAIQPLRPTVATAKTLPRSSAKATSPASIPTPLSSIAQNGPRNRWVWLEKVLPLVGESLSSVGTESVTLALFQLLSQSALANARTLVVHHASPPISARPPDTSGRSLRCPRPRFDNSPPIRYHDRRPC